MYISLMYPHEGVQWGLFFPFWIKSSPAIKRWQGPFCLHLPWTIMTQNNWRKKSSLPVSKEAILLFSFACENLVNRSVTDGNQTAGVQASTPRSFIGPSHQRVLVLAWPLSIYKLHTFTYLISVLITSCELGQWFSDLDFTEWYNNHKTGWPPKG